MNQLKETTALEQMIRQQVIERGIREPELLNALRAVPRDKFFPADGKQFAYADRAAPIGHGQTISQPYMVALMTQRLELRPEHRVLEVGTGSGYQTAILAKLAAEVYSTERVKPLLDEAFERIMDLGLRNVHFRHTPDELGYAKAGPYDRIIVTAGAPVLPTHFLLEQLKDGGIAVLPIGPMDEQMLMQIKRKGNEFVSADICPCRFVKLIGPEGFKD
jgi:protein-L-isoaspartate(D-aspartate) O-methyltransferase